MTTTKTFQRPHSIEDALLALQHAGEDASYIAGGTDMLVGDQKVPEHLISLRAIDGLAGIEGGRIGATTPIAWIARDKYIAHTYGVAMRCIDAFAFA